MAKSGGVASSSLGLIGDLDDVDLIEDVEGAFDYRLSDDDIEHCRTVGDLFELVVAQLPDEETAGSRCATSMCFYRLRRAIQARTATALRPRTPIEELSPLSARALHRIIREECRLRPPPPPYMSLWGGIALILVIAIPLALLILDLPWWIVAASALPPIALYRVAPIRLPKDVNTFGDLVRSVASRSIGNLAQQGARLRSPEAWAAFRDILGDHTALPKEEITPDTLLLRPRKVAS